MISNYQHTSVNRIVIARNRKPLCSDLPFKMQWFCPSNPIKCVLSTVKFNKNVCFCSQCALLHNQNVTVDRFIWAMSASIILNSVFIMRHRLAVKPRQGWTSQLCKERIGFPDINKYYWGFKISKHELELCFWNISNVLLIFVSAYYIISFHSIILTCYDIAHHL